MKCTFFGILKKFGFENEYRLQLVWHKILKDFILKLESALKKCQLNYEMEKRCQKNQV